MIDEDRLGDWTGASVAAYGYLGLIPFWAPVAATLLHPAWGAAAGAIQAIYGGLILSFLGGARFGRALEQPGGGRLVGLSMIPSIYALAVLVLPQGFHAAKPILMAAGLAAAWRWDRKAVDLQAFYKVVRTRLTLLSCLALTLETGLVWSHG